MRVLVYEDNLMWSSRLVKSLKALGHEALLRTKLPAEIEEADAAIVNLGSASIPAAELIPMLKERGIHVIGHAGHKETELIQFGKDAGCDTLATNSQITFKLEELLFGVSTR
jgi:hypothetical protein